MRSRCQLGIVGIGLGQALADGEAGAKRFQRVGEIALRHQHVADLVVGHGEIALPAGIVGVGLGQALADREAGAIAMPARR